MSDLREILTGLYSEHGRLTPALVVDAATPEDHPLHHRFEWNDSVAGPKYREVQARALIRSVKIVYKDSGKGVEEDSVRYFASINVDTDDDVPDLPNRTYVPVDEAAADPLISAMILRAAQREWQTLWRKYSHLEEFIQMVQKDIQAA